MLDFLQKLGVELLLNMSF